MKINQIVIFAGGYGKRLLPLTKDRPKPMVDINNFPFLDYLINSFVTQGITNFLILTGYKNHVIEKKYSQIKKINIEFSYLPSKFNTYMRLKNAKHKLDKKFILIFGDNYMNLDLKKMINFYKKNKVENMLTAYSNLNGDAEYGLKNNLLIKQKKVLEYNNKYKKSYFNATNIGFYFINKQSINFDLNFNKSFEETIILDKIKNNNLFCYLTNRKYYFITNKKNVKNFSKIVKLKNIKPLSKNFFKI